MATSKLVRHMLSGSLRTGFCRLCLCEAPADWLTLSDNLSAAGGALTLAEVLRSVAPALLWHLNGMLSDKVCRECCQKATAAYHFQLQCQQTAATLHHCVAALHTGLDNSVTSTNKLYIYVKEPTTPLKEPIIELRSSIEKHTPNSKLLVNNSRINDQYSKVPVDLLPLKTQVKQENMSSDGESSDAGWRKRVQIKSELGAAADPGEEDLVMVVDEAGVPSVFRYADETKQHLLQLTDEEQEYFFCKHPHFRPRLKRRGSLKDVKLEKSQNSNKLGVRSRKRGLFSCKLCHAQFLACDVETFAAHCEEHTQRFNCDHCSKSFKYRRSIVNHLRNSHSWKCQMSSSANYTCYYCGKGYLCVSSFEAHIRKHEAASSAAAGAPSRNKCQFCGDWCETRYLLRQHVYRQHPAERPYPCPTCHKKFRTHSTLKHHTRSHNEEEASHHCEMCWRNFVNERALRWHQRLHTGERPFACEQCGKAFISLNRRNQHALTSHTQPTKQCPLCPALFHLRSMVNTHIRKVHLKIHKRLSRPPKYTEVEWATQKVPLEELSLHVQAELLQHKIEPRPYVQRGMEQF